MTFPRCGLCGGDVELRGGTGRHRELLRGLNVLIPDDFEIPTCVKCGETMMVPEVSEALDAMLRAKLSPVAAELFDELKFGRSPVTDAMRADLVAMMRAVRHSRN